MFYVLVSKVIMYSYILNFKKKLIIVLFDMKNKLKIKLLLVRFKSVVCIE